MRLFRGAAVMPRDTERTFAVRTYLVVAPDWREARAAIERREPDAQLVTVPVEMPQPAMTEVRTIDAREFGDLRSACAWNEARLRTLDAP